MTPDESGQIDRVLSDYSPDAQAHVRLLITTLNGMNAKITPPVVGLLAASFDAGAGNIKLLELSQGPTSVGSSAAVGNVIDFASAAERVRHRRSFAPTA